jgi:hypothetical protein
MNTPLPTTLHANSRELAHALRDYARPGYGEKLYLLPFNRFRPDDSAWWICPGTDDPAYHYGKFAVKPVKPAVPYGDFFCGIVFEKGIGSTASSFFDKGRHSWIVRPSWIWRAFFESLKSGQFDTYVAEAQQAANRPVDVIVSAGIMSPPVSGSRQKEGPDSPGALPRQKLHFSFDGSELSLVGEPTQNEQLIQVGADCRSLKELGSAIEKTKQIDWMWVDVECGFRLAKEGPGPAWHTQDIWSNACEPFLEWFR